MLLFPISYHGSLPMNKAPPSCEAKLDAIMPPFTMAQLLYHTFKAPPHSAEFPVKLEFITCNVDSQ